MKRALIIYNSQTGTTRNLGIDIRNLCQANGIESKIVDTKEFTTDLLENADYLFLGSWTHGLMICLQHPDKLWVSFTKSLPEIKGKKIVLFTTYKLATGSMFRKMRKLIKCGATDVVLELKSRNGNLNESNTVLLNKVFTN